MKEKRKNKNISFFLRDRLNFRNLASYLRTVLGALDVGAETPLAGRLGPAHVQLDPDTSQGGRLSLRSDRLAVSPSFFFTAII